ncbi:BR serine/threonine kinase [Nematocida ausubeli]|nr:BR serine/threonine kinase [Nematocida ausubeli]
MQSERAQSSITLQSNPNTKKIEEEGQVYFEIYTKDGFARSISSPVPLTKSHILPGRFIRMLDTDDAPDIFSKTRILYSISSNRNSHVFLGVHTSTQQQMVIKIISTRIPENQSQAKNETQILPLLRHKSIIKYIGAKTFLSTVTIYLEYFKGTDLFFLIKKNKIFPAGLALKIFRELADAIKYLHVNRICHLDIKPENIMINSRMQIKLIDFGLAQKSLKNGLVESYGGSINYASPEARKGGVYNGFLADSWSCGVVLFVMVNGFFPSSCRTPSLPHVPVKIIQIIQKLLAISPEARSPICSLDLE